MQGHLSHSPVQLEDLEWVDCNQNVANLHQARIYAMRMLERSGGTLAKTTRAEGQGKGRTHVGINFILRKSNV